MSTDDRNASKNYQKKIKRGVTDSDRKTGSDRQSDRQSDRRNGKTERQNDSKRVSLSIDLQRLCCTRFEEVMITISASTF